ncbi:MAG TPA: twin-arginine translocase TatA/TatE family subunit [Syntrophorhabdales bacterium]|nr:twin-arginine translocase TatA/TatE family subunit [Syntrophorhabdales bacterium]
MFEGLFQPTHLIIILVIALVVFGPSRVSDLGSSLGKAIRGFKKSMSELTGDEGTSEGKDKQKKSSSRRTFW